MPDEYAVIILTLLRQHGIEISSIKEGAISCVVPPLLGVFHELFERYFNIKPLTVGAGLKTGVRIRFDNPREIGHDRISNTVGALSLYKAPLIVVSLGTATVFDTISKDEEYLGGAVAPGICRRRALRTAALKVELLRPESHRHQYRSSDAVRHHLWLPHDGVVTRIQEELGQKAKVVATGGYANVIAKETKTIDEVNPNLTLLGIKIIHSLNRE
jgi:type III pantothenate kinase